MKFDELSKTIDSGSKILETRERSMSGISEFSFEDLGLRNEY